MKIIILLWNDTKSGSIDSISCLTKHKYQGNLELLSDFEKPAFIQYRLLWIYSIRGSVCNNSAPTSFAVKLPDQQLKMDKEKKEENYRFFQHYPTTVLTLYRYL